MGVRVVTKSFGANRSLRIITANLNRLRNNHRSRFSLHELVLMEQAAHNLQAALDEAEARPDVIQEMTS